MLICKSARRIDVDARNDFDAPLKESVCLAARAAEEVDRDRP